MSFLIDKELKELNPMTIEEKAEYDYTYVFKSSLFIDVKILLKTVK